MKFLICIFAGLCINTFSVSGDDYCAPSLCPNGMSHVGCEIGIHCPLGAQVISMSGVKSFVLDLHNMNRDKVAGGKLAGFSPAQRMMELTWDDELANLAILNAKQCCNCPDGCHNTKRFQRSGQNIMINFIDNLPESKLLNHLILGVGAWFREYTNANMSIINSFRSLENIDDFTIIVSDRQTKVGCGTVRFPENGRDKMITTCNYSAANIFNSSVYVAGPAASKCTSGRSASYPNLCSTSEPINPNSL